MNWDAIGAIAELGAAVGVIVSLLYVGLQLQQTTRATRAATAHQSAARFTEWMENATTDPIIIKWFGSSLKDIKDAPNYELWRLFGTMQVLIKLMEEIHYQWTAGMLDDEHWRGWNMWFSNMKSYELVEYLFTEKSDNFSISFQKYWTELEPDGSSTLLQLVERAKSAT